jgi:hypothetical protein
MKKRPFRKYNRGSYWIQQRDAAFARAGKYCEVTGEWLLIAGPPHAEKEKWRRACHHVVAERFARKWVPGCDVHCLGNLVVVTPQLHARLTHAENRLFKADIVGYRQALNQLGFDPSLFDKAMTAICASVKK